MNEIMPIKERQNTEENINYLSAQKQAYNKAKNVYIVRMILTIFSPVIFIALYFLFDNKFQTAILVVSSLILIVTFFMELYEKDSIKLGATIQEQFDTSVFNIEWNLALVGDKVNKENLYKLTKPLKEDTFELKNWYTSLESNSEIEYALKAQSMNVVWSIEQKGWYKNFLSIIIFMLLIIYICIACWNDFLVSEFFITLFFPSTSLFIYLVKGWADFRQQLIELKRIDKHIKKLLFEIEKVTKYNVRSIQDSIYVYGRLPNNIVPSIIYRYHKKKLEPMFKSINKPNR